MICKHFAGEDAKWWALWYILVAVTNCFRMFRPYAGVQNAESTLDQEL